MRIIRGNESDGTSALLSTRFFPPNLDSKDEIHCSVQLTAQSVKTDRSRCTARTKIYRKSFRGDFPPSPFSPFPMLTLRITSVGNNAIPFRHIREIKGKFNVVVCLLIANTRGNLRSTYFAYFPRSLATRSCR